MNKRVLSFFIMVTACAFIMLIASGLSIVKYEKEIPTDTADASPEPETVYTEPIPETPVPTPEEKKKIIYLTFDDGPYMYTEKLLGYLDKYGVKATFFVTAQNEDYVNLIQEEFKQGNAVGIHTYCHKYKTIYGSDKQYLDDFYKMQNLIKDQTGSYSKIYRFPGGSSNTVSKYYCNGVITRAVEYLDSQNYVYFDWNITSEDSEGLTVSNDIFESVVRQIEELDDDYYIVLQHDIYECSVDATEQIIIWGLENGYVFDKLDVNSKTVHFEVAN